MNKNDKNSSEIESYIPYIYNIAFKLSQDRQLSEDLVQETLLKAWQHWDDLKVAEARKGWLRRICVNIFLMQKRKEPDAVPLSLDALSDLDREGKSLQVIDASPLPEDEILVAETIREMRDGCFLAMTRKLTLEQRMAFSLTDMFGMGIEETAEIIGVSVSAAKALLHRARTNLDSFFAKKCSMVRVENPCRCEAYLNFQNERLERQDEVRNRIQTFRFGEQPPDYLFDADVRQKVRTIYVQMPDRIPEPSWFETVVRTLL